MLLWNIHNKLCEATTQICWARNVEERHGFWWRNGGQRYNIGNCKFKNSNLNGIFEMLILKRHHKSNFTISAIHGCRNKFRYFPWAKLALDHVDCMRLTVLREDVSISCVTQHSLDHKAVACKSDNRVKHWVSNERWETEICQNIHLNIGLAQDCGISSAFATGIQILGHIIYNLLNLAANSLWTFVNYSLSYHYGCLVAFNSLAPGRF